MTIKCEKLLAIEIGHKLNFSVHVDDICKKEGQNLRVFFLSTILVIIFWNFTMFQCKSDSPHVKQFLIVSTINLVYELPHELPNDLRLRILANIMKFLNLAEVKSQYSVSLPIIQRWQQQSKNMQQISKPCHPLQFYLISLFCCKHFAQDCRCYFTSNRSKQQ